MAHAAIPKSEGHDAWLGSHRANITYSQDVVPAKGTPYTFVIETILNKSACIYIIPYDFENKIIFDITETLPNGRVVNKYAYPTAPMAKGLVYHDLGEENHYCGL